MALAASSLAQWVQASVQVVAVAVAIATYFIMIVPQQQLNVAKEELAKTENERDVAKKDLSAKQEQIADAQKNLQAVSQELQKKRQDLAAYEAKVRLFVVDQFTLSVLATASRHALSSSTPGDLKQAILYPLTKKPHTNDSPPVIQQYLDLMSKISGTSSRYEFDWLFESVERGRNIVEMGLKSPVMSLLSDDDRRELAQIVHDFLKSHYFAFSYIPLQDQNPVGNTVFVSCIDEMWKTLRRKFGGQELDLKEGQVRA
jgi:hypothetical protein